MRFSHPGVKGRKGHRRNLQFSSFFMLGLLVLVALLAPGTTLKIHTEADFQTLRESVHAPVCEKIYNKFIKQGCDCRWKRRSCAKKSFVYIKDAGGSGGWASRDQQLCCPDRLKAQLTSTAKNSPVAAAQKNSVQKPPPTAVANKKAVKQAPQKKSVQNPGTLSQNKNAVNKAPAPPKAAPVSRDKTPTKLGSQQSNGDADEKTERSSCQATYTDEQAFFKFEDGVERQVTNEFCATQCVEVGDGSCTDFEDSKHPRIWCKSHCHGGMVGVKLVPATDDNAVPCVYHGTDKKRTEEETESLCKGCIMNKRGMCVAGKDGGKCHKMCFPEVGPTQILQPSGDKDSHYANMCLDITIPTNVPMLSVKVAFEFSENKDLECNELAMENKLAMEGEVKEGFTPRRCRHGFEATVGIGLQVDFVVGAVELYFLGALSFESKTTIPCLPWALRAKNQFMKEAFCKPHASSKTKQTDIVMCLKRKTKEECTKPGPESDKPCEWSKVPGYWSCGTGGMLKHFVKSFVTNKLKKGGPEFDAQLVKAQLDKEADSYEEMDQDEIDAVVKFASDVGQEVREARFRKAVALSQAGKQHREKREKNCAAAAAVEKECNALTYLELCLKQKQGDAAETCSYLKKSGRAPGTKKTDVACKWKRTSNAAPHCGAKDPHLIPDVHFLPPQHPLYRSGKVYSTRIKNYFKLFTRGGGIADFPDMGFRKTGIEDAGAIAMSLPSKLDQKNGAPCYSEDMCKSGNCMDIAALNGGSLCVGSKSNPECDGDVLRALACPENCDGPSAQQAQEQCEAMGGHFVGNGKAYYYCKPSSTCLGSCTSSSFEKLSCGGPEEELKKHLAGANVGHAIGMRMCSPKERAFDKILCEEVYKGHFNEGTYKSPTLYGNSRSPFWGCLRNPKVCEPECEGNYKEEYKALTCGEQTAYPCLKDYDEIYKFKCSSLQGTYTSGTRTSTVIGRKKFWHTCKSNCRSVKKGKHATVAKVECNPDRLRSLVCARNCGPSAGKAQRKCERVGGKLIQKQDSYYCEPSNTCKENEKIGCDMKTFEQITCGARVNTRSCSDNAKKLDRLLCTLYKGDFNEGTYNFMGKKNYWVCKRNSKCPAVCKDTPNYKHYYEDITCGEKTTLKCIAEADPIMKLRCQSLRGNYTSGTRTSSVLRKKKFWYTCKENCSPKNSFAEVDASVLSEVEETVEVEADGTVNVQSDTPMQELMKNSKYKVNVKSKLKELTSDLEVRILFVFWARYVLELALLEHLFFSETSKWWTESEDVHFWQSGSIMAVASLDQCNSIPYEEYGKFVGDDEYGVSGAYRLDGRLLCTLGKAISRLPRLDAECDTADKQHSEECDNIRMLDQTYRPGQDPDKGGKSVLEEMRELQCINQGKECVPKAYKHKMKECVLDMKDCIEKFGDFAEAMHYCETCRSYPISKADQTFDMGPEERMKTGYLLPWDPGFDTTAPPETHTPKLGYKMDRLRLLPKNRYITSRSTEHFELPSRAYSANYFLSSSDKDQSKTWASQSYAEKPQEARKSYIPAKFFLQKGEESAPTKGKSKETVINWIVPIWTANVFPQLTEMFVSQAQRMRGRKDANMKAGSKEHVEWLKQEFLDFVSLLEKEETLDKVKADYERAFGVLNAKQAKKVCEDFEPTFQNDPVEVSGLVSDNQSDGPACSAEDVNKLIPGRGWLMIGSYAGQVQKFKAKNAALLAQMEEGEDPWRPVVSMDYETSFTVQAGGGAGLDGRTTGYCGRFASGTIWVKSTWKWGGSTGKGAKAMEYKGWGIEIYGKPLPWLNFILSVDKTSWNLEIEFYLGAILNGASTDTQEGDPQTMMGHATDADSGKPDLSNILAKNGAMVELAMDLVVKLAAAGSKPKGTVGASVKDALWDWVKNDVSRAASRMAANGFQFLLANSGEGAKEFLKNLGPSYTHWYAATLTLSKQSGGDALPKIGMILKSTREIGMTILGQTFLQYSGETYDLAPFVNNAYNFKMSRVNQRALLNRQHGNQDTRSDHCKECSRQIKAFLAIGGGDVAQRIKQYENQEKCHGGGEWSTKDVHRCNTLKAEIVAFARGQPGKLLELATENPSCSGGCWMSHCPYQNVCAMTLLSVSCQNAMG